MKEYDIFIDLDGVVAGFDEAMLSNFGVGKESMLSSAERWALINEYEAGGKEWFLDLPLKPGAIQMLEQIWNVADRHRICILSATGNQFFKHSSQKGVWCRLAGVTRFVNDLIFVPKAECKQFYANDHSILIDDNWDRCVKPFIDRGGWGIHHLHPELTMQKLRAILEGKMRHPNAER